jgi:hypothetical protein
MTSVGKENPDPRTALLASGSQGTNDLKWREFTGDLLNSLLPFQRSMLGILAISKRLAIDPSTLLKSLACELHGQTSFELKNLAEELNCVETALDRLENYPRLMPPDAWLKLKLAQHESELDTVFSAIERRIPRGPEDRQSSLGNFGLIWKALLTGAIVSFLCMKVIPELARIFDEFGLDFSITSYALRFLYLVTTALGVLILVFVLVTGLGISARLVRFLLGRAPWYQTRLPKSVFRKRLLASWIQIESPASARVERPSRMKLIKRFFPQLKKTEDPILYDLPIGQLWEHANRSQTDLKSLSSASPETQAWILRWQAASQENRYRFRRSLRDQIFSLIIHCGFVLIVLLACILVFGSLIQMLNQLSQF